MRNYISLVGIAFGMITASIQAGGCIQVAAAKQQVNSAPVAKDEVPGVLYPVGHKEDKMSFMVAAYYLGGYAGQTNMQVATGGVVGTRAAAQPSQGKPVFAPLKWANGARVDAVFCGEGMTGHSVGLNYDFITANHHSKTVDAGNYLPTYAINNLANTASTIQSSVTTVYHMPWFQEGRVWYNRGPIVYPMAKAVMSLETFLGVQIVSTHHKLDVTYTDSAANTMTLHLTELSYGGGPLAGVIGTLDLGSSFAFRGSFGASIPVVNDELKQSDDYNGSTYGLNTKGSYIRQVFGTNIDLDAVYRYDHDDFSLEVVAGWSTTQYLGIASMMQATTAQGSQPGNFATNLVKAGLSFIF